MACTGDAFDYASLLLLCGDLRLGADDSYRIGLRLVANGVSVPTHGIALADRRLRPDLLMRAVVHGEMVARLRRASEPGAGQNWG